MAQCGRFSGGLPLEQVAHLYALYAASRPIANRQ